MIRSGENYVIAAKAAKSAFLINGLLSLFFFALGTVVTLLAS
jgi:sulfite exporter TauE/SafE